jgi:hypothetical protein
MALGMGARLAFAHDSFKAGAFFRLQFDVILLLHPCHVAGIISEPINSSILSNISRVTMH